jgi:Cu(I)/Ag(I) efflux system membrane fusion protein
VAVFGVCHFAEYDTMNKSKWIIPTVIFLLLAVIAAYFVGKHSSTVGDKNSASSTAGTVGERKILYWKDPMDPNYRSNKPGKSPMGMELVPAYAVDNGTGESSDVKISSAEINSLGVHTTEVQQGSLSPRLELVGYVGYDEDTIVSINTRADGWVEKLAVKSAGDNVRRGQLLYELFSPKLATAEREYLTSLASGSPSLVAASRERMQALGFSAAQVAKLARTRKVSDRVSRYAENAGVLMSLGVSEGAYVMPATQIMKIADLRMVWVLVEVDESQAALVHVGQKADAVFDAFPGQHWQGVVDYVYPDLSSMTRTVKVRLRFSNADLRLQPNMYAHIKIEAKALQGGQTAPQDDAVYIPNLALIRTGNSQRVIVALGEGRFDICPVEAGLTSGDKVQILKGLQAGQRVVTSAMFLIDSEANVDATALNYSSAKPGCSEIPGTSGQGATKLDKPASKDMPGMDMSAMPAGDSSEQRGGKPPVKPAGMSPAASKGGMSPGDGAGHNMQMPMPSGENKGQPA